MQAIRYTLAGAALTLAAAASAAPALAEVKAEVSTLAGSQVTLYAHDFLTEEELATLRLVASEKQALALFVPEGAGFAAMAVSPEEGFIRGGAPVPSAAAVAGLPDAATADAEALKTCDAAKKAAADCVILLQVAPK